MPFMILAIDPGPTESAYVIYNVDSRKIMVSTKCRNSSLLAAIDSGLSHVTMDIICERIRSYGMPAGEELFETCEWSGRYWEATVTSGIRWHWMTRKDVKLNLCGNLRANDANVRQAIIDRFGGKAAAIGRKATPGPLYGISRDMWAALGVALTWVDVGNRSAV